LGYAAIADNPLYDHSATISIQATRKRLRYFFHVFHYEGNATWLREGWI
jgi:hypothetical protein